MRFFNAISGDVLCVLRGPVPSNAQQAATWAWASLLAFPCVFLLQADLMESWCGAEGAYFTTVSVDEFPGGVLLSSLIAYALLCYFFGRSGHRVREASPRPCSSTRMGWPFAWVDVVRDRSLVGLPAQVQLRDPDLRCGAQQTRGELRREEKQALDGMRSFFVCDRCCAWLWR